MSIRRARPGDVPLVLELIRDLAEYEREPDAVVATEDLLHRHLFGSGSPAAECLIGEVDDRPQGFALFFSNFSTWVGWPGLYLEDLFVRPQARGRGLGKALLAAVARVGVERGCKRLDWSVLNWNEPAIGFYESLGARPLSQWTVYRLTGDALHRLAAPAR
ncbi:MAG: GNAT family N-acetyltransferase [Phycisphaerales bacterium]|nr:GNAT family N-acetyltransferase [Phycisphaerales bacterium]